MKSRTLANKPCFDDSDSGVDVGCRRLPSHRISELPPRPPPRRRQLLAQPHRRHRPLRPPPVRRQRGQLPRPRPLPQLHRPPARREAGHHRGAHGAGRVPRGRRVQVPLPVCPAARLPESLFLLHQPPTLPAARPAEPSRVPRSRSASHPPKRPPGNARSYPENNMVSDPLLAAHLAHFGVDAAAPLKPTARSVVGLGLDARAHFHHVLGRWIGAEEDAVGAIFASFHPLAQDLLIQEYRRQTRVRAEKQHHHKQRFASLRFAAFLSAPRPAAAAGVTAALRPPSPLCAPRQAYHALQRRCAGEGALGWRPPPRGDPEAAGGSEAEHLGLERDPVAAEQEAAFADMPLDELQEARGRAALLLRGERALRWLAAQAGLASLRSR